VQLRLHDGLLVIERRTLRAFNVIALVFGIAWG
jgi:hypothetical protein